MKMTDCIMIRVTQMSEFTGYPDFNLKKNVKTAEQIKYARFKVYENCISSGKCTICMELIGNTMTE